MFEPLFQTGEAKLMFISEGIISCLIMALLGLLLWFYNKRVQFIFGDALYIFSHGLFVAPLALLLLLMGSASTAQMIGAFGVGLGGFFLLSFFRAPLPQMLALISFIEIFFCLYAYHYVDVGVWYLGALSLSLLAPYGTLIFRKKYNIILQYLWVGFHWGEFGSYPPSNGYPRREGPLPLTLDGRRRRGQTKPIKQRQRNKRG